MFERFERLMKERKLTFAKISRETGIPYSTFTDWKAGRYTPKLDKLQKIANFFGVSVEYLSGETDAINGVASYVQQPWYTDPDAAELAQRLFDDPAYRVLFDAAADATPEDLQAAADILRRLKEARRK